MEDSRLRSGDSHQSSGQDGAEPIVPAGGSRAAHFMPNPYQASACQQQKRSRRGIKPA
jgi:hypothetical protein